jgi:hypothetical protein
MQWLRTALPDLLRGQVRFELFRIVSNSNSRGGARVTAGAAGAGAGGASVVAQTAARVLRVEEVRSPSTMKLARVKPRIGLLNPVSASPPMSERETASLGCGLSHCHSSPLSGGGG